MLYFNLEKKGCTGCTACATVCPAKCIKMVADEEGFVYPVSNDSCIHCGRCERVCPIVNRENIISNEDKSLEIAYCAISKQHKVWQASASGGAFTEICKAFADNSGVIYGAAWNKCEVQHLRAEGVEHIAPLKKSKYVESRLNDCFLHVLADVEMGKSVVFCGTPCQVAGLRQCFDTCPDNLLLVDLICHGVGSPKVFAECISLLDEQFGKTVRAYEFRAKRGYHETDHLCKLKFSDESCCYITGDPYMQLFLNQDCLRPSCGENCRFRSVFRPGDITIADFKRLEQVFPKMLGVKKNYSTIVFNTEKGLGILPALIKSMDMTETSIENVKEHNPLFHRQTFFSKQRDIFFDRFINAPKETVAHCTTPATVMRQKPIKAVTAHLPVGLRRFTIKVIRRFMNNEK